MLHSTLSRRLSGKFCSLIFPSRSQGARLRPQVRIKLLRIRNPSEWELALFLSPPVTPLHLSPNGTSQPKTSKILLVQLNLFPTAFRSWNKLSNNCIRPSLSPPPPLFKSNIGKQAFGTGGREITIKNTSVFYNRGYSYRNHFFLIVISPIQFFFYCTA